MDLNHTNYTETHGEKIVICTHQGALVEGCFHWDEDRGVRRAPLNKTQTGPMDQGRGRGFTQVQIRASSKNQQATGKYVLHTWMKQFYYEVIVLALS